MYLETLARPYFRAWSTNADTTSFATRIPTVTEPANDGVVSLVPGGVDGGLVPTRALILVYGLGADNDVASLRILGWCKIGQNAPQATPLWVPVILGEFVCTISTAVGVAGAPVLATERFADTITPVAARNPDRVIGAGTAVNSDLEVMSPANNTPAFLTTPLRSFWKLEFCFDQTTNTPTMNALVMLY